MELNGQVQVTAYILHKRKPPYGLRRKLCRQQIYQRIYGCWWKVLHEGNPNFSVVQLISQPLKKRTYPRCQPNTIQIWNYGLEKKILRNFS